MKLIIQCCVRHPYKSDGAVHCLLRIKSRTFEQTNK